jgi:hydroxymethylpyrimidine pyrophosphatase-like HAD family hydrolase
LTITADPESGQPLDLRRLHETTVESVLCLCPAGGGVEPILHTFENGRDWIRWRPQDETDGVAAFLAGRPDDPRLRPIASTDPLDPAAVFYIALLADNPTLTAMRRQLAPHLDGVAHFLSVDPATPGLDWLELHNREGTKAEAIRRLMTTLDADRLVVFGDNHNDLPMFAIADESYAVSNAVTAVLEAATGIIGSNDHNAVANWITDDHKRTTSQASTCP